MSLLVGSYVMVLRSSNSFYCFYFYLLKNFFSPILFRGFRVRAEFCKNSISPLTTWNVTWSLLATILGSVKMYLWSPCAPRIPSRDLWAGGTRSIKCPASWAYSHKSHFPCTHFPAFSNAFHLPPDPRVEGSCFAFIACADAFIKNFILTSIKCCIYDLL